jgi:hypothetical protein
MDPSSLRNLDLVLGCFHPALRRKEDQTERYLTALSNPSIHILGHPCGRIYNFRLGLTADWSRVFGLAADSCELPIQPHQSAATAYCCAVTAETAFLHRAGERLTRTNHAASRLSRRFCGDGSGSIKIFSTAGSFSRMWFLIRPIAISTSWISSVRWNRISTVSSA